MCFEIKEAPADLSCSSTFLTHPIVDSNLESCPTVAYATQTFLTYLCSILKPKSDSIKTADKIKISNLVLLIHIKWCNVWTRVIKVEMELFHRPHFLIQTSTNGSRFLEIYHFSFICMWNLMFCETWFFVKLDFVSAVTQTSQTHDHTLKPCLECPSVPMPRKAATPILTQDYQIFKIGSKTMYVNTCRSWPPGH